VRLEWSRELPAPALGLSLSRESGTFLVWDGENQLARFDKLGQREWRRPAPASLVSAVLSDEGKHIAVVGRRGHLWLLSGELSVIWERALPRRPVAAAIDHLGQAVAVADEAGGLHVFDPKGRVLWRTSAARPLVHLAFVPESGLLVGSAEFGLVCVFDQKGQCLWRDGLVAHVGSLAVSGNGGRVVLACFTEGLCCYSVASPRQLRLPQAPCRLAAVGYLGKPILSVGLEDRLALRDAEGSVHEEIDVPGSVVALGMMPFGDLSVAALATGSVIGVVVEELALG
jgi:hypothetical protein